MFFLLAVCCCRLREYVKEHAATINATGMSVGTHNHRVCWVPQFCYTPGLESTVYTLLT